MKNRVAGWLASAVAVAAGMFAPVTALNAYAEEWTEVSTWADLAAALNAGSQVKLMQNVSKSADYLTVDTGKTSVLDLNGHTIERLQETSVSYGFVIYVCGGDLTIMDSSAQQTGKITGGFVSGKGGGGVSVDSGGHLTLAGGSITGNKSDSRGGGVYIDDESCTFTMTGGSITNNTVTDGDGGGVFLGNASNNANFGDGSCFIMSGGTISGNTANQGGGVFIKSLERASNSIHSFNTFQMSGGTISGNTATSTCGGIYLSGSGTVFTMTGGSLTGNTASSSAGGIYVTANTQMNIGGLVTIDGNTAADVANNVKLAAGSYLNITEPLDAASSIGVSSVSAPTSSRQVQVTTNLNRANYSVFSSDNEDYYVEVKEDGDAYLFLATVFNISVTAPAHGTLSANMSTARPGKTVTLTVAADPTYRVDHVYYKPNSLNEQEINPVDGIYSFPMPTRDVTVRAVFAAIPLSVGLDPGMGGGTASSTQVFPADGIYTYTLPDNPYTAPENKFFDGWSLNGNRYQPGDAVTLTEDCVFTAQWNSAAVHFDANGGSGFMADEFCGTSYTLPACGFLAPDRHCFTGWLVGDTICQPGAVITVEGDTTLTAQWDLAYTISSSSVTGGYTFTVTRKDASEAATIKYRTVNQSAIAGVHYRAATGTLTFGADEYSLTTPTIELLSPGSSTIEAYYKSGSTKRSFGFEVFDPGSHQRLASYTRSIDFNTSYKVPASGTYDEKTVTVKSEETTITDDGYDSNSPISYSMSGYYSLAAPKEYLQLSGAQLRMVVWFDAKEDDDGYQYLSILTNTSDYDNRTDCSNGDPGNLSKSLYMIGFEHDSGDKNTTYARYSMPLTAYGNCGAVTAPWAHTIGDLTAQKFKSGCRASDDGRLIFPLSASTLAIRGNASGKDDDDWVIKNISAKIQAVDTAVPTVGTTYATSGTHGYGDTVTIAVRFSEIVNVTGSPTLNTNFGTATYKGGSGTCVLYFTVPLDQNSTAGSLQLGKLSGTIKDLAGKSYSGSSSLASPSGTSYEGYGLVRMHGLDNSVVSQTYTRKNGTYMFPTYTGELEEGKEFDCYKIGDAEYRLGDTFTASGTHDVYVQLKWKEFPVTFYNYDGTTALYSVDVTYNGSPSYPDDPAIAPAPAKPSTAQYEYAFTGWTTDGEDFYGKNDALPAVTEAVTYTAVFEESVRKYEITWIDGDGNTLKTGQVAYGQTPAYTGATPTKTATAQYTYMFNNTWSPALAPVTGPAAYTAQFDSTVNTYTITWLNDDGSEIDTTQVEYGTVPTHADPAKEATAQYSYTFAGWDPEVVAVTAEATYTAQFTPVLRSYTITWVIDGVETTETLDYGETPAHADPVKASTPQYSYTFAGWEPAIASVTGDATYTAQFTPALRSYAITWVIDGVETTETLDYGEMPAHADPAKASTPQYSYTFAGWAPAIASVTGNATYTAQFDSTVNEYAVTWKDGDGNTLKSEQIAYGETPAYTGVTPTKTATAQYTYTFNNSWSPAIVSVTGDATYTAQFDSTVNQYAVIWKDGDGNVLKSEQIAYGETPSYTGETPTKARDAEYSYVFNGSWSPAIASVTGDATYTAQFNATERLYVITWVDGNGTTLKTDELVYGAMPAYTGDTPTKTATAQYTYTFSGWSPAIAAVSDDVTYTAQFSSAVNEYTITWLNDDGSVIDRTQVEYGAMPVHADPSKAATPQYSYSFVGWSPALTAVTGEATYTAQFDSTVNKYTITWTDVSAHGYFTLLVGDSYDTYDLTAHDDSCEIPCGTAFYVFSWPDQGYVCSSFSITDADGTPLQADSQGLYTMPASDVAISAIFAETRPITVEADEKANFRNVIANGMYYGLTGGGAIPGSEVTVSFSGTVGYEQEASVATESGAAVAYSCVTEANGNRSLRFTMPEEDVTVSIVSAKGSGYPALSLGETQQAATYQVYSFTPADSGAYSFSWTQAGGSLKVYDSFGGSLTASSEPFTVPLVGGQTYYVSAGFAEGSGAFSVSLTDGGAALYNIFPPTGYGTVSCAASAPAGSRVYLKPVPDTGYAYVEGTLRVYFIFDEETLYEAEDGWFWFTMPDHDVYVQAQFEPHYVELSFAGDERANPISIAYENTQTSIEGTSVQVLAGLQTVVTVAIPYDCELSAVLTTAGGETVSCSCRWDSYNEWSVTFTAPEEDATITFTLTPLTLRALALDEPLAVSGDREIFTFTPEADGFYRFVSSNLDAALFVAADDGHNLVGEPYPYGTTPSLKLTAGHTYYVIYEGDDDGETYTVTAFSPADYTVTFHADPEILLWENSVEADGNPCSGETFTVSNGGSVAVYFELPAFFGWEPTVSFETASGEAIVYELTISDCHILVFRMPAENVTVTLSAVPVTYPALALGENALTESDETYSFTAETAGYYSFVSAGHNIMIFDASNWCFDGSDDEAGCVLAAGQQVYVTVGTDLVDPDPSIVPDETITVTLESALESYAITIADGMTGGTVTTDVSSAPEGGSVFVTVTPEEGMELGALVVRGANTGRQIPMSSNSLYEDCHFTMPDEPVTIRAIFAEKPFKIRFEYENANGPYYVTVDCASGERPSAPDMYWYGGDDGCYYLVEGWSDGENVYASYALPPATADATYTAVFSQYNNETAHAITVESEPGTFVTFLNIDGNYFPVNNPWEGVTVALYATASGIDDGWYIAGFTVTDADGNKLPLFIDQWGYPCFRMPASDVTVTFTYTQDVQTFRIEKDPEAVSFNGAMVNGVWRYSVDEDGFPAAPGSEVWIWLQSDRTLEVSVVPEGGSPIRSRCEEEASFPGYWGVYFTMPNAPVTVTVTAGEPNLNKAGLSLGINTLRGDSYSNNTYFFSPEEDGLYSFSWVGDRPDSGDIRDAADTAGSAEDYWSESGSFYLSGGRTYILTVDFSGSKRYFLDIEREETPQTHTISLANAANGTAELSHAAAPEGTAVLVQMNVAPGYDESYPKITYYDGESWQNEYCEATATKGLFYFIMPAADVTVTPVFYPWYHEVRLLFDGTAVHPVISLNGESQEGSFTAYTGDTIELEIEPYNGYYVDGVTVNGEELLPEGGVYSLTITDESECIFEIQIFHVDHKHTWGEWETLTAATCTEAAVETRSCTVDGCGAAQTRTVGEPLGHDYVAVVTKEPTATEEGIMTYTCSRCGVSYMLYIPKLQAVYPAYLDGADGNVKANYVAWAAKYGPDTESAYETAFLLNIDPATVISSGAALLKVVRFDLTAAGCRLELASDMCGLFQPEGRSGTSSLCNGVLVVELADDLGAFATSISLPVTIDASGHAVIDFDFGDVALPSALFLRPAIAVKGIVKD